MTLDASQDRRAEKQRVALISVFASGAMVAAKLAAAWFTGSLALLSEALHSTIDLGATLLTLVAIRYAERPADATHPFGHGKFESVAAFAETALLLLLAGGVAVEAVQRLFGGSSAPVEFVWLAIALLVVEIGVNWWRARALERTAEATSSEALAADALHFRSDLYGSVAVIAGLLLVAFGLPWGDAAAALAVALLVALLAIRLGKRTFDTLTDASPEGLADRVRAAVEGVEGVTAVTRVRARPVGPHRFIEVAVDVARSMPLDRVAATKAAIEQSIAAEIAGADVTVTVTPRALDDESVLDRVMVTARNRGLAVHHVTVHHLVTREGLPRTSVALDLEVDGSLPLGEAHAVASELESAVKAELGPDVEVETHIEPLQTRGADGRDAPETVRAELATLLATLLPPGGTLTEVHNVRARETSRGLVVVFHCRADPAEPIAVTHERVDMLERRLRAARPDVVRAIGHAEPRNDLMP